MHAMDFLELQPASTSKWFWGEIAQIYKDDVRNNRSCTMQTQKTVNIASISHISAHIIGAAVDGANDQASNYGVIIAFVGTSLSFIQGRIQGVGGLWGCNPKTFSCDAHVNARKDLSTCWRVVSWLSRTVLYALCARATACNMRT